MRFDRIYQVKPEGNIHAACLDHVAEAFAAASSLPLERGNGFIPDRSIVIGGHLHTGCLGKGCAIWNTEVVQFNSPWMTPPYIAKCRAAEVWDYSHANVVAWRAFAIRANPCRLLYDPAMVDARVRRVGGGGLVFFGSMNARRQNACKLAGAHVLPVGTYGDGLARELCAADAVLNLHYYAAGVLETVRLSYLWANGVPVISEEYHGSRFWRDLMPPGTFLPPKWLLTAALCEGWPSGEAQREAYQSTSLRAELAPLIQ